MLSNIEKVILLQEDYGFKTRLSMLNKLFGKESVKDFIARNPNYEVEKKLIFRSSSLFRPKTDESKKKLKLAKKYLSFLKNIPWIKFAGVSGSVAYLTADEKDDIDIFIMVQKDRLWITRGIVRVILTLTNRRRKYGAKEVRDKICTNFYIEENIDLRSLFNVENNKVDEFLLGLELAMIKPVISPGYYSNILKENNWIFTIFPGLEETEQTALNNNKHSILSFFVDFLNLVAMKLQVLYMKLLQHPYDPDRVGDSYALFFEQDGWDRNKEFLKRKM